MRFKVFVLFAFVVPMLLLPQNVSSIRVAPISSSLQAAGIGFSDDFEATALSTNWSIDMSGQGIVEVNKNYVHSGTQSMFLGQKAIGAATASLILSVDLSGQTAVFLDFWTRSTGFPEDRRVFISDNGGTTWTEILNLDTISRDFSHIVVDLTTVAANQNVVLNGNFRILFSYAKALGTSGNIGDGIIIDDVRLAQRAQAVANFPLTQEGFEAEAVSQGFYLQSFGTGMAGITNNYPHGGTQSVFLRQNAPGAASALLVMVLDLSGQTDVFLDFWVRSTGAEETRQILISDDSGATWAAVLSLDTISRDFSHIVIDLADIAAINRRSLNNTFRIAFFYAKASGTSGNQGDGMVIDDVRLTQRAQAVARFPLAQDSFESDTFTQGIYPRSFGPSTAAITTDYPHSGTRSFFLRQSEPGVTFASLDIVLDISQQTSVFLDFWARSTGSGEERRVLISGDNGNTWVEILNLDAISQNFSHVIIDVADAAAKKGVSLNNKFRVSIYYAKGLGSSGSTGDGMVIDDLRVGATNPISHVYLPLLRR